MPPRKCDPVSGYRAATASVEFAEVPNCTFIGTGGQQGISLECSGNLAVAGLRRLPAILVALCTAAIEFVLIHFHIDRAVGDVDTDQVTILNQPDGTAGRGFRRGMADGQP